MLRDLIFHVQEHRFTLPQIKGCLNELAPSSADLKMKPLNQILEFHGNEADIYDLELWHQYEKEAPEVSLGCISFGARKCE